MGEEVTKEQRETLESYVRVTAITGPPSKVSVAIRACLDRLTTAERVVEEAREMWSDHNDGHICASENVCPSCCVGIALAAYDKETGK